MLYIIEVFSGEHPPYNMSMSKYTDKNDALHAYHQKRQEADAVWVSLMEWKDNCGQLIFSGWCNQN